ncbi:gas vesicle protein GvpFL [Prescottella agglutinans]|uniref:Gas vesicle protein GvpFL n=1 Tax=Prescottella agglutinans TaxID=1644129 RepID=A0A438BEP5_9NOCA|nr:GvpL/GvpF family gas vesicle protein [Prescottella agglutinans]RVW09155.1 gas vesicle protein GvpFL [Prescottella agglutinans]
MTGNEGVWVYAVTSDGSFPGGISGIRGVAGESLRTVADSGLAAVVGSVALDEFGEAALHRNLEDLDWLSDTARRHDAVVAAICAGGATIPLRLATVYYDDERVRAMLRERVDELEAALDRIADRTEWGVRSYGHRDRLAEKVPASDESGPTSGTAYLMRRRAQAAAREDAESAAAAIADEIYSELERVAVAAVRQRPSAPGLAPEQSWEILNASYLVDNRRTREFTSAVEAINDRIEGAETVITGPWPPYSFTADESRTK